MGEDGSKDAARGWLCLIFQEPARTFSSPLAGSKLSSGVRKKLSSEESTGLPHVVMLKSSDAKSMISTYSHPGFGGW